MDEKDLNYLLDKYNARAFIEALQIKVNSVYDAKNELEGKNKELQERLDKIKDEIVKDKMEQFDDYVICLLEKYEKILEEETDE